MAAKPLERYPLISQLCNVFGTDSTQLESTIAAAEQGEGGCFLRLEAHICFSKVSEANVDPPKPLLLGWIDLRNGQTLVTPEPSPGPGLEGQDLAHTDSHEERPITVLPCGNSKPAESSHPTQTDEYEGRKRRKVVGGLRLRPRTSCSREDDRDSSSYSSSQTEPVRQLRSETRFPQRSHSKKASRATGEPSSVDKLISGIWRQLHSNTELNWSTLATHATVGVSGEVTAELFKAVSNLCLRHSNKTQTARALEMIVQAYWTDCYEARIKSIRLERPASSASETRVTALKEACSTLGWGDKELRNKMAIWRGYKEIKDAGGWASLVFASSGVYRFCKYRTRIDDGLALRLQQIRSAVELAADTLHPKWRELLNVIGQGSVALYNGHPHEWVIMPSRSVQHITSTYRHLQAEFLFKFIDESIIDRSLFGDIDPRYTPDIDQNTCQVCGQLQSDDTTLNRCACFPALFGAPRKPVPIQIFHTTNGKNNGVIARCDHERGAAIAEFVGFITNGIEGLDVMAGGSKMQGYQIFQGQMGNFTRFINHSCHPNSQFQKFYWRGREHIIVVSRGILAGNEITVDYSDHYWERLDKACLCGESSCRFPQRKVARRIPSRTDSNNVGNLN
ncbi:SET domain-containing protein [Coccidioides immitis RS]|uniref:SET domain-containing protein n=2 Tax=Coccidioides immitis TaxID=5501 RepID=J3KME1_COCIM|nr:SET domain-containing protein [Coccidioides immitis RS]EAS37569.3 SET domain-containing protein [Coccidioides immitis RS]KMU92362.1 SET domain-containing protein [Coccidioides immitis H538.4]TPX24593.1 hypothetical protein DIZ76_010024 [Coccidioides immitis]